MTDSIFSEPTSCTTSFSIDQNNLRFPQTFREDETVETRRLTTGFSTGVNANLSQYTRQHSRTSGAKVSC